MSKVIRGEMEKKNADKWEQKLKRTWTKCGQAARGPKDWGRVNFPKSEIV